MSKTRPLLEDEYTFEWKIGSGSFGEVWLVIDKKTNKKMAFKMEEKSGSSKGGMLRDEYKIYLNLLKGGVKDGIPKIYQFMQTPKFNIMVMELLDKSIEKIFNDNSKKFNIGTVLLLGINMIKLLKSIHQAGYIHRDIKPNNFMLGFGEDPKMYIMDFGLSKRYIVNDKHIQLKTGKSLIGTARYASINVHMGFEPSRRDDLISVGYMLIYFVKGKLPWQGLKKDSQVDHLENIGDVKMCMSLDKLCKNVPICLKEYLKYCINLKFDEEPDYDKLLSLLTDYANKNKIELKYEWMTEKS
jgi:serine/threonine protein kinase